MTDSIKILVADDEELNLDILSCMLEEEGFKTILAHDGDEVIKLLETTPDIAMILLDRMMPRMSGMEVVRNLKQTKWKNIPVIMQSAAASNDQIQDGQAAGVFSYLPKPFNKTSLMQEIQKALNHCGQHV